MQINDVDFIIYNSNERIKVLICDTDSLKKNTLYFAKPILPLNDKNLALLKTAFEKFSIAGYLKKSNRLFFIRIQSLPDYSNSRFSFTIEDIQTITVNPVRLCIESDINLNDKNRHWYCSLLRNDMTLTEFVEIPYENKGSNGKIIINLSLDFLNINRKETDYGIFLKYCDDSCVVFYLVAFCIDSGESFMNCYISSKVEANDKQKVLEICRDLYLNDLPRKRSPYRIIYDRNVLYYDVSKKSHDKNGNVIENIRDRTIEITIEQWEIQTYMRAMSKGEYESLGSPEVNSTFKFTKSSTVEKFVTYEFERKYFWATVKSLLALPNPPAIFLEFTSNKSPTQISEVKPDYGELGGGIESILNFTSEDTCTVKRIVNLRADFSIILDDVKNNKQYQASIIPNRSDENFGGNYDNHFICSASIETEVKYYYLVRTENDMYKVLTINKDFVKRFLTDKYYPEYLKKNQEAILEVKIKKGN